ncbi:hypothetical protein [Candidatus Poriferisodalis sp.]|uniref:hypothetical protein n=1 Tax=Candidatus Poriferisodalis sp. TaxID=3101277 RepID=UPI003B016BD4
MNEPYEPSDFSGYVRETLHPGWYIADDEIFKRIASYANSEAVYIQREKRLKEIASSCLNILRALRKQDLVMLAAADLHDPAGLLAQALEEKQRD